MQANKKQTQCHTKTHTKKKQEKIDITGEWRYYWGNRWLANGNITDIFCEPSIDENPSNNICYFATEYGLTVFSGKQYTLSQKASEIQQINYPRHDRYGLVGDCGLKYYGIS